MEESIQEESLHTKKPENQVRRPGLREFLIGGRYFQIPLFWKVFIFSLGALSILSSLLYILSFTNIGKYALRKIPISTQYVKLD